MGKEGASVRSHSGVWSVMHMLISYVPLVNGTPHLMSLRKMYRTRILRLVWIILCMGRVVSRSGGENCIRCLRRRSYSHVLFVGLWHRISTRGYVSLRHGVGSAGLNETAVVWESSTSCGRFVPLSTEETEILSARPGGDVRVSTIIGGAVSHSLWLCTITTVGEGVAAVPDSDSVGRGAMFGSQTEALHLSALSPHIMDAPGSLAFRTDNAKSDTDSVVELVTRSPFGVSSFRPREQSRDCPMLWRVCTLVALGCGVPSWLMKGCMSSSGSLLWREGSDALANRITDQDCGEDDDTPIYARFSCGGVVPEKTILPLWRSQGSARKARISRSYEGSWKMKMLDPSARGNCITIACGLQSGVILAGCARGHLRVFACQAFSDGRLQSLCLHTPLSVLRIGTARAHRAAIVAIADSPTYHRAVTGDSRGVAVLWSTRTLDFLLELRPTVLTAAGEEWLLCLSAESSGVAKAVQLVSGWSGCCCYMQCVR